MSINKKQQQQQSKWWLINDASLVKSQKRDQNPIYQNGIGYNSMLISALLKINLCSIPKYKFINQKISTNLCGIDFEEYPRDVPSHQKKDST